MTNFSIKTAAVVGAGTMGQGISQVLAMNGIKVILYDLNPEMLTLAIANIQKNLNIGIEKGKIKEEEERLTLQNLSTCSSLQEVKANFIIEAVIEDLEVKRKLFKELEIINSNKTILATNTSSIPITQIATALSHPERFLGIHFFNPAHIMKLVEIISGADTDPALVNFMKNFIDDLGKVAVIAKDSPGFIVNRVARHFYVESLKALEENVADVVTIDKLIESYGFKMGPFRLMDLIGVDTNYSVTQSMFSSFHLEPKFRPSRIQQQKVDAGHWGIKTGKGFYQYSKEK
jgi:3-hydroxybutyryl-CoA dehydrogenase